MAMELSQDGSHVRLRSLVRNHYLHADEDGESVSIHEDRASLSAAWAVHVHHDDNGMYLLLHSAANGRYLAATDSRAPLGHRGFRVKQQNYEHPEEDAIRWEVVGAPSGDAVLLRNVRTDRYLRANGRIVRWKKGVTVDDFKEESTMRHWIVEPIPDRLTTPGLAAPVRDRDRDDLSVRLRLRVAALSHSIRFVQASNEGIYPEDDRGWRSFIFWGRSVYRLRNELARILGLNDHLFIMCVRGGRYGRLTPLIENLPQGGSITIAIVIFRSGTPAANELRHPDVDAA